MIIILAPCQILVSPLDALTASPNIIFVAPEDISQTIRLHLKFPLLSFSFFAPLSLYFPLFPINTKFTSLLKKKKKKKNYMPNDPYFPRKPNH